MRTLSIVIVSSLLALTACGGNKKSTATAAGGSGSAASEPTPVPTAGSAVAAGSATTPTPPPEEPKPAPPPPPPEPDAFMKLSHDEKVKIMEKKVLPAMTKLFKAYDGKHFAKFGCKTCHGKGGEKGGDFKMPNPDLPVLDFDAIKAGKQDPKMAEWMGKTVKPEMAKLLGVDAWDEQHPAGFGCHGCHMIKGM